MTYRLLRYLLVAGATLALMYCAAACKGQVPPTTHSLTVTVTNAPCAPGTPASTCGYVFSEAVITGTTCPANTGTAYSPVNQSAPVPQPASGNAVFTDPNVTGKTVCAIGQTISGGAVSQPSAVIGPFAVPANPTAPAISGQAASLSRPVLPQLKPTEPTLATWKWMSPRQQQMQLIAVVR